MRMRTKHNLVVCQKSKINDWVEHFKMNYPNATHIVIDYTDPKQAELAWTTNRPFIIVINYDLVFRRKELLKLEDFTLMLDESSIIQNEGTKRADFILKMHPANVILLSGTPISGRYENLISQMKLLGWTINEKSFWNNYVTWHWDDSDGFMRKVVDGYKNVERLKRKMREHGCHFLKTDEVFDLPEQIHQTIRVDETKEYRLFKKNSYIEFDDVELIGDTTLTKMLYERQLCGQYNVDKFIAFRDLVDSTNDRLIVFYNFNAELDSLRKIDRPISVVNGNEKDLAAYEECENSVTFIQYQAGAMGLNLQKANKIIYFTPPLSSELFEQSKKRVHRINQTRPCFYYYLTCGIDCRIYDTLAMRRDFTDELFLEVKNDRD